MATVTVPPLKEQIRRMKPVAAPPEEQADVARLLKVLGETAHRRRRRAKTCALVGPQGEIIEIPDLVLVLLGRVAEVLARGDAVTVVSVEKGLTTQQAADLLDVSRQYLVRLLDEGRIPHTKTGKHRRLRIQDVLAFKKKRDAERKRALRHLTELTESFGGYENELE